MLQPCRVELQRVEVKRSLENDEGLFLGKDANRNEVTDMQAKTLDFLAQRSLRARQLDFIQADGGLGGEASSQLSDKCSRVSAKAQEIRKRWSRRTGGTQNDKVRRERKQLVRLCGEVSNAVADRD